MKKGISIWAFGQTALERAFELAAQAGFEGVEVALAESGELTLETAEADIEKIKAVAENAGLALYSVASGLYWEYSLTSNDPVIRKKAEAIAKKQLDVAAWLGCGTVLVVPGIVDESVSYDLAYDRALDALKRLAPYAEQRGVVIGVENVWNKFLLSPLEMRDFIDNIGSPFVKAYFDVGNVVRDGYPEQWINILGSRIAKIHFKDYKRAVGTLDGFVDLLEGDVDYPAVMAALSAAGYNGWLTAEVFSKAGSSFEAWINGVSRAMDVIIKGEQ